jgi:hypothetical protein
VKNTIYIYVCVCVAKDLLDCSDASMIVRVEALML